MFGSSYFHISNFLKLGLSIDKGTKKLERRGDLTKNLTVLCWNNFSFDSVDSQCISFKYKCIIIFCFGKMIYELFLFYDVKLLHDLTYYTKIIIIIL